MSQDLPPSDAKPVVVETPEPKVYDSATSLSKRRRLRRVVLWAAVGLAVFSPLFFMAAALGSKFGLWSWQFGLGRMTTGWGPKLLFVTLFVALLALLLAFLFKPRRRRTIITALLCVAVPVLMLANLKKTQTTVASLPFIHDVSTDTQDPPTFGDVIMAERAATQGVNTVDYAGKRARTSERDANGEPITKLVSALQTQGYPEIRTLVLSEAPGVAFGRAEQIVRDMGWTLKDTDADAGRIDATDTTFWYGFKDDVTIRLRPAQGGGTRVDVRSVSRVGGSDIGANAARIESFLDALKEG